jgi:tetratricopeptide (TPR) repeat protein
MLARRFVVGAWAVAFLISLPVGAAAQKSAFIDAFIDFHVALSGTYGDEGPRVTAALDRMEVSLDAWERANREAEQALKARGNATPIDLAVLYVDELRLDDAITSIRAAIDGEPRRASYHELLGLLEQATGRPLGAGAAFLAAHSLDPTDRIATYLLAAHIADQGDGDTAPLAAAMATVTPERGPVVWPFPRLALLDDLSSRSAPVFSPPLYAVGFEAMAAGRFREGLNRFRTAAAEDPLIADQAVHSPRARAGIIALRDRRGSEAITELEAAASAFPSSSETHRALGVAYRAVGRLQDGVAQFETAVRLAPRYQRARIALGTTLMEAGRLAEAERALREAIAVLPASGDARWALAQLYERLDRGTDAVATLEAAIPLTVMAGKSHLYWRIAQLAHAYRRDHARVIGVLSKRAWLLPGEAGAHRDLGLAYYRAGRMDEGLIELQMARLLGREDAEMLTAVGHIHLAAGRLDAAERTARQAVALDPDLPSARYILGTTLQRTGHTEEAAEHLNALRQLQTRAIEGQRRSFAIDSAVNHARHLARAGQLAEAAAAYEAAVKLGAEPDVLRELAAMYARLGRSEDRARALARAEALQP